MKNRTCSVSYAFSILVIAMLHAPITIANDGGRNTVSEVEIERTKTQKHTQRRHKKSHRVKEWSHRASRVDQGLAGGELSLDDGASVLGVATPALNLGPSAFEMPFDPWVDGPTLDGCDVEAMEELYLRFPHKVGAPDFMRAIAAVGCSQPEEPSAPMSVTTVDIIQQPPLVFERSEETLEELDETITEQSVTRRSRGQNNPSASAAQATDVEFEVKSNDAQEAPVEMPRADVDALPFTSVVATHACPSPRILGSPVTPPAAGVEALPVMAEPEQGERFEMPALEVLLADEPAETAPISVTNELGEDTQALEKLEDGRRLMKLEREILSHINRIRARHNLAPLRPEARLAKAAVLHSRDMFENEYFSHIAPRAEGRTFVGRIKAQGLKGFGRAGENLAQGPYRRNVAKRFVRSWMKSPEHRANILKPNYRFSGIGVYGDRGNLFATQLFAQRLSPHRVR